MVGNRFLTNHARLRSRLRIRKGPKSKISKIKVVEGRFLTNHARLRIRKGPKSKISEIKMVGGQFLTNHTRLRIRKGQKSRNSTTKVVGGRFLTNHARLLIIKNKKSKISKIKMVKSRFLTNHAKLCIRKGPKSKISKIKMGRSRFLINHARLHIKKGQRTASLQKQIEAYRQNFKRYKIFFSKATGILRKKRSYRPKFKKLKKLKPYVIRRALFQKRERNATYKMEKWTKNPLYLCTYSPLQTSEVYQAPSGICSPILRQDGYKLQRVQQGSRPACSHRRSGLQSRGGYGSSAEGHEGRILHRRLVIHPPTTFTHHIFNPPINISIIHHLPTKIIITKSKQFTKKHQNLLKNPFKYVENSRKPVISENLPKKQRKKQISTQNSIEIIITLPTLNLNSKNSIPTYENSNEKREKTIENYANYEKTIENNIFAKNLPKKRLINQISTQNSSPNYKKSTFNLPNKTHKLVKNSRNPGMAENLLKKHRKNQIFDTNPYKNCQKSKYSTQNSSPIYEKTVFAPPNINRKKSKIYHKLKLKCYKTQNAILLKKELCYIKHAKIKKPFWHGVIHFVPSVT